ncbi:MAG: MMPL family transporter [Xanthomonadales bacterium]|nr:MMPL family transporter [Xanthomonadales bacterium]
MERDKAITAAAAETGEEWHTDAVNLRLATGNIGVMAAINDTVRASEHTILYLLYAAVFVMCLISFRSLLAALCILLPLVLVTELGHSLMVHLGIGMKVNTLCVVALGVGIGVDYGIYIYARMAEALKAGHPLTDAYFIALKTTGIAIFYTALTFGGRRRHVGVLCAQVPSRYGTDADLRVCHEHDWCGGSDAWQFCAS